MTGVGEDATGLRTSRVQVIQVVGTSYRQASVAARERVASARSAASLIADARELLGASECVLLRTCNRVELYYLAPPGPPDQPAAKALICGADEGLSLNPDQVDHRAGLAAVRHLFEVASGLDSMVLGEYEIMGQVRRALLEATRNGWAGPVLRRLFDHAVRTGKRARRETAISSGIFSVGQCAARMAQQVLGSLEGRRVLVFGAGRIARVTAKHLVCSGVGSITVFSRTYRNAQELADACGGQAVTTERLPSALAESDIVVGCASAPHYVIRPGDLAATICDRGSRPLVVVDLGVPRNVDPGVGQMPGVCLFNIDDLERVVEEHAGEREQEVQRVKAIVEEEAGEFHGWLGERSVSSIIAELRAKAEEVRQECLWLAERKLAKDDVATAAYLLDLLVRKLLHAPIAAIRGAAAEGAEADLVAAARRLFGLEEGVSEDETGAEPLPTAGRHSG